MGPDRDRRSHATIVGWMRACVAAVVATVFGTKQQGNLYQTADTMSDYAVSEAYWSRMRGTTSPPTVHWVDDDPAKIDEILQMLEVECPSTKPRCGSLTSVQDFFRFLTEYVWDHF